MRARMVKERAEERGLDLKMGEGGIADIEFATQGMQMQHARDRTVLLSSTRRALHRLALRGHLREGDAHELASALDTLQSAREALALVDDARAASVTPNDERLDLLARAGVLEGKRGADIYDTIARAMAVARELSTRALVRLG
jgi:glutamate-ammonia-ligase adenylyltransferase